MNDITVDKAYYYKGQPYATMEKAKDAEERDKKLAKEGKVYELLHKYIRENVRGFRIFKTNGIENFIKDKDKIIEVLKNIDNE